MIMGKSTIGVYGMGVMGQSLALNMMRHGYQVSVFNIDYDVTETFLQTKISDEKVVACKELKEFVDSLEKPRRVFLMVTAGKVTDLVIDQLKEYLEEGDIIIDGGNSYFKDTIRRFRELRECGLHFVGTGVSGGERGALEGPSMMPSGDPEAYQYVEQIFTDISAKAKDGAPCCAYIGGDGSGHYVKMVHNGIEYADIQIICEAYDLMRHGAGLSVEEIQQVFERWNKGRLKSYLIEITGKILKKKDDETGKYLVDVILDKAGQKGTGKWTSMEGLDIGAAIPTIAESVFSRYISAQKEERVRASQELGVDLSVNIDDKEKFIDDLEAAVYAAKICCYAQGFELLKKAAEEYEWTLDFGQIAMIWREGCIIRADFLEDIKAAYDQDEVSNLMLSSKFKKELLDAQKAWRRMVCYIVNCGIYAPALTSTLNYFDGYRCARTSANLTQAQRDFFGAHTYERVDKEGIYHTIWEE
ncbi:MAG TPA: NADP-dependent phosphogluconate dehydrogenase [Candidatus Anaerostipes excrementavium]|uniref:6-phosphogluconate dehydrogenase, decarboxylating n=1 Tax=Candidatus Anaerostipes excrementavium TaxID=2838463 RepID=A0A9D1WSR0_9FIRM|nr:NADP-dependent phosphogluconate dehydrogenase [Candidatus Anaerostipes excrementavium]